MNCPVCHVDLERTDRQGVEIEFCPQCRGMWLDRGEIDKIVGRSLSSRVENSDRRVRDERPDDDYDDDNYPGQPYQRRGEHAPPYERGRRESWWRQLFDWD